MTFKEGKTPNVKKRSNFFILMYVLLCDTLSVYTSQYSPFKTNLGEIHQYSNLICIFESWKFS